MKRLLLALVFALSWLAGPAWAGVINVNTATAAELDSLPGIGPSKATAIVEYREANGPFTSLNDLDKVSGIGPATLENLAALVTFEEGGAPAGDAPAASESSSSSSSSASSSGAVDINTASASQLESMPGIGPSKATAIIEYREANGPFGSCSELSRVTGIGDATVANIASVCTASAAQ
jgi:competence protein ComEA